jgi:hypothetical protein
MAKVEYNKDLLCKDCKHAKSTFMAKLTRYKFGFECTIPEAWNEEKFDPVFGKTTPGYFTGCSVMRLYGSECGPEAKKWAPRNSKLIFLALKNR